MPYTGLPNRDVMQLVTGGGRLDAPPGCPLVIYRIMADCWNPTPEERPTFSNLLERLTTCTQVKKLRHFFFVLLLWYNRFEFRFFFIGK